jgi:hypothetical protein
MSDNYAFLVDCDIRWHHNINVWVFDRNRDKLRDKRRINAIVIVQEYEVVTSCRQRALRKVLVLGDGRLIPAEANARIR